MVFLPVEVVPVARVSNSAIDIKFQVASSVVGIAYRPIKYWLPH